MSSEKAVLKQGESGAPSGPLGATVELRYAARAGLLPELSRQTYDSFYKAAREAVLNAIDADATRVDLDFSRLGSTGEFVVQDDGSGMSIHEFCDQFMSLGGSSKFGHDTRFGRIGIGSLALLHYGNAAVIETKRAGARTVVRAHVEHPWSMARDQRRAYLADLRAGTADEVLYEGSPADHFTRVRILDARPELRVLGDDPAAFYGLVEKLRRILPLPWSDSIVLQQLTEIAPEMIEELRKHVAAWAAPVYVHSPWEMNMPLTRRLFGDDAAGTETWIGRPAAIHKRVRVVDDSGSREISVIGFLVSQKQAFTSWSGLTARIQNVAVEEQTFFDVTTDPGFRKYITGEVWIAGAVDREHLINIDRSTFNRECPDYGAVQRFMSRFILDFKKKNVQRPQRLKVDVRRKVEAQRNLMRRIQQVVERACETYELRALPSSEASMRIPGARRPFEYLLRGLGAEVVRNDDDASSSYKLSMADGGEAVLVRAGADLLDGKIVCGDAVYRIVFAEGAEQAPRVVIRNRPREIVFNLAQYADERHQGEAQAALGFALELGYLLTHTEHPDHLYAVMSAFIDAV
ncbi:MAG: hypothetical protein QOH16_2629 [Gaiellaceae bacterium]|nr:hypothetical protein [Gaiellaceae bacterium]